tara:strand:- start:4108 stop:4290 length:183 start_codon:yes stop_codon:yes gene_type:complete
MWKKILVIGLALTLVFALSACGIGSEDIDSEEEAAEAIEDVTEDIGELSDSLEEINEDLG